MRFRPCIEILLLWCALARADDPFKQHYEAGLSLYSSEDYESAVKEFQAAYAVKPRPRLLFNIGQSYRSLGNAREALRFYMLYQALESNPKPGLKAELDGYIVQMKSIVEQAERAQRAEELPSLAKPVIVVEPTPAPLALSAVPPDKPPLWKRGWLWGVVAGAAASVLVVGLAVGLTRGGDDYQGQIRHPMF